jgi:hypothetical protein
MHPVLISYVEISGVGVPDGVAGMAAPVVGVLDDWSGLGVFIFDAVKDGSFTASSKFCVCVDLDEVGEVVNEQLATKKDK